VGGGGLSPPISKQADGEDGDPTWNDFNLRRNRHGCRDIGLAASSKQDLLESGLAGTGQALGRRAENGTAALLAVDFRIGLSGTRGRHSGTPVPGMAGDERAARRLPRPWTRKVTITGGADCRSPFYESVDQLPPFDEYSNEEPEPTVKFEGGFKPLYRFGYGWRATPLLLQQAGAVIPKLSRPEGL